MKEKSTTISDAQSEKIAIRLKQLREEKGISHDTLANETGISKPILIKYEKSDTYNSSFGANRGMSVDFAVRLADYYNTSIDYLLCKTDTRTPNTKIRAVCEYMGLSENTIEKIRLLTKYGDSKDKEHSESLNFILSHDELMFLLHFMNQYKKFCTLHKLPFKSSPIAPTPLSVLEKKDYSVFQAQKLFIKMIEEYAQKDGENNG